MSAAPIRSPLQQALYDALTTPPLELDGRPVSVFDAVPQGTPSPYVTIGEDSLEPDDTDDSRGSEGVLEVSIWSGREYAGRKQAKDIGDAIYARLHQAELAVAGYTLAALFWDSSENFDEADGATRRTVEGYRVLLQE